MSLPVVLLPQSRILSFHFMSILQSPHEFHDLTPIDLPNLIGVLVKLLIQIYTNYHVITCLIFKDCWLLTYWSLCSDSNESCKVIRSPHVQFSYKAQQILCYIKRYVDFRLQRVSPIQGRLCQTKTEYQVAANGP